MKNFASSNSCHEIPNNGRVDKISYNFSIYNNTAIHQKLSLMTELLVSQCKHQSPRNSETSTSASRLYSASANFRDGSGPDPSLICSTFLRALLVSPRRWAASLMLFLRRLGAPLIFAAKTRPLINPRAEESSRAVTMRPRNPTSHP